MGAPTVGELLAPGSAPDPELVSVVEVPEGGPANGDGAGGALARLVGAQLAEGRTVLVTGPSAEHLAAAYRRLPAEVRAGCGSVGVATDATPEATGGATGRGADLAPVAWGYAATPGQVEQQVTAGRDRYGWVPLPVRGEPPLTAAEVQRLLLLHVQHTPARERRGRQAFPAEMAVPTTEQVRDLAERLGSFPLAAQQIDPRLRETLDRPDVEAVLAAFHDVDDRVKEVLELRRPWVVRFADTALAGADGELAERVADWTTYVEDAGVADYELAGTRVEGLEEVDEEGHRAITALAERVKAGERLRRRFRGRTQRAAGRWLDDVRVDGEPVTDAAGLHAVRAHLEVHAQARALAEQLVPLGVPVPTTGPRGELVARLVEIGSALESVARLVGSVRHLVELLASGPAGVPVELRTLDDVERIRWTGQALGGARVAGQGREELEALAGALTAGPARAVADGAADEPAPEVDELVTCLRAADAAAYGDWLRRLDAGRREHRLARMRADLHESLAVAAPALTALLAAEPVDERWSHRLGHWAEAWAWARAATWLAEQQGQSVDLDPGQADVTERVDPTARPVWLVPVAELAAAVPAEVGPFDVVVVDDAGRVALSDLAPLRLARRVVALDGGADAGASSGPSLASTLRGGAGAAPQAPAQAGAEAGAEARAEARAEAEPTADDDPRELVLRLADGGPISTGDAREVTGLSAGRVRRLLQALVEDGHLVRSGRTSATRYRRADGV